MALIIETEKYRHKNSANDYVIVLKANINDESNDKEKILFTYEYCSRNHWLTIDKKEFLKRYEKVEEK